MLRPLGPKELDLICAFSPREYLREETKILHQRLDQHPKLQSLLQPQGCVYVIEGSTLGGQFILKWLQRSLHPRISRLYFTGYGSETRAIETFISLERWLTNESL
jgi:heme oxygenase